MYERLNQFQKQPLGWPSQGYPSRSAEKSFCGVGSNVAFGRPIIEKHVQLCLHSGVRLAAAGFGDGPGTGFFEVGPCTPIEAGDHLWMARYILNRIGEDFNVTTSLTPKLINRH